MMEKTEKSKEQLQFELNKAKLMVERMQTKIGKQEAIITELQIDLEIGQHQNQDLYKQLEESKQPSDDKEKPKKKGA